MSSSFAVNGADRERLLAQYPQVFQRSFFKRYGLLLTAGGVLAYLVICFFAFNVGPAFMQGRWDRASSYIQDWYSWRAQPRLRFDDGKVVPQWSSRGQYPANANIDWLQPLQNGGYAITYGNTDNRLDVTPARVDVHVDGVSYPVMITADAVTAPANAPGEIRQDGSKVIVDYGFAGQAEIRTSQVYVQRRFLGWANFFFDTRSAFWGKRWSDLAGLAFWGERIDPAQSNLSKMQQDFLNNDVWQHADILSKLMQTLVMAFVGTLLGTLFAFPLAFIAARNITQSRLANWGMKRMFDFLRSIDMLIWALFFTRSFGPGPIPGIAAIFFTDTGALGKVYAEALENVDDKQREGVKSVGASPAIVNRYGVIPQVLPVFISQSLYFWESNTRSATIIGAVGAGGIGLKLLEAMGTNADWDKVAYMVLLILMVVFLFDNASNAIRSRLIGKTHH
ncbi:phosphonate ABC transporter, permease protein PhnE [Agrobacterium sp. rho-13.3]|uniref:phosphonate ABC transporter, permease protein PhnE n=1 Tax=Agrobacterium sp. rho-13.3 TaxID=3072980 RepID=UPI002A1314EC|nr:phosphonate ABC transporter, permease protein PhnE [Agrobacterium sp. rho-13.3]MDX8309783.1 phosphonate ABC transporter, permease protein PhnE [Agrobacterium sp. rho-13.3]